MNLREDDNLRILYISFDNPAVETILGGMHDETLSGLPAFYYPFKILLERGHTIDLLLFCDQDKKVVESKHFKTENLILVKPKLHGILSSVELPLLLAQSTRKLIKTRHYDFVYGMTEGAHMAVREAERLGIPCAIRQFGTQEMANVLEMIPSMVKRCAKAMKDYTYITLTMQSKKSFLLATNDGSRADKLYEMLGIREKKFRFYFWTSGVAIPETQPIVDFETQGNYPLTYDPMALSMINRIADVKRQDRAVQILGELHRRGYPFHLYFIGDVSSQAMLDTTNKAIEENNVAEFVHFEGGRSQKECRQYARNSFATLLPCEWNRVNIFYEVLGEGSIIVTNNNHSIDEFIEPDVNCLLYDEDNFAQAAEKIIALTKDPERMKVMRAVAHQTAKKKLMSLEKRFGMEAQLLEDVARGRDTSGYPAVL